MRALNSFASERAEPLPDILDVHKREAELYRLEFAPFIGDQLGDKYGHSLLVGAHADIRFATILSLGGDFGWSKINFDRSSSFGRVMNDNNLYAVQGVLTFNLPAAFVSGKSAVEADFFTTIGGGAFRINRSYRPDGFIGGGMKMYLRKISWFGLRVEIRNYFSTVQTADGNKFSSDLAMMLGPSFMISTNLKK